jgi:hypothetical protein
MYPRRIFISTILIVCLLFFSLLFSDTRVTGFTARKENNKVILEWSTEFESGLEKFIIHRSTNNVSWLSIGEVKPPTENSTSPRNYRYVDNSIYKNNSSNFYYKLLMIDKNGQTTSYHVIVSIGGNSGIRHTWGSIKAMFR